MDVCDGPLQDLLANLQPAGEEGRGRWGRLAQSRRHAASWSGEGRVRVQAQTHRPPNPSPCSHRNCPLQAAGRGVCRRSVVRPWLVCRGAGVLSGGVCGLQQRVKLVRLGMAGRFGFPTLVCSSICAGQLSERECLGQLHPPGTCCMARTPVGPSEPTRTPPPTPAGWDRLSGIRGSRHHAWPRCGTTHTPAHPPIGCRQLRPARGAPALKSPHTQSLS